MRAHAPSRTNTQSSTRPADKSNGQCCGASHPGQPVLIQTRKRCFKSFRTSAVKLLSLSLSLFTCFGFLFFFFYLHTVALQRQFTTAANISSPHFYLQKHISKKAKDKPLGSVYFVQCHHQHSVLLLLICLKASQNMFFSSDSNLLYFQ